MRFVAGLGGSACLAIGGGVIADLFPIQQRGRAQAMFVMGPLAGPVVGPIIGGFIAQRAGWRWVYWVLLMACGVLSLGFFIVSKETNAAVLVRQKTNRMIKETGRTDLKSAYDANKSPRDLQLKHVLATGIARPFKMIFSSPILPMLALYMSFVFGLVYLIFTTVSGLFIQQYGWSPELCGLA
jgi:MFS family permease